MKNFIKYLSVLGLCFAFTSESYEAARQSTTGQMSDSRTKNTNSNSKTPLTNYLATSLNDNNNFFSRSSTVETTDKSGNTVLSIGIKYNTSNDSEIDKLVKAISSICKECFKFKNLTFGESDQNPFSDKFQEYMKKYLKRKQRSQIVITLATDKKLDKLNKNTQAVNYFLHTYTSIGPIGSKFCKVYCYARSASYNIFNKFSKSDPQIEITLSVPSNI